MTFEEQIIAHEKTVHQLKNSCLKTIEDIAIACNSAIKKGNKILICGNGGSAADSQHIAAELVGRFVKERESLPAIALTTDTSILTAVGNDYGYDVIFKRQIQGLAQAGDVLIGISTSGNSKNIVTALEEAKKRGVYTIAFTGEKSSKSEEVADITLKVPSTITARIQECHILVGHMICDYIDKDY